MNRSNHPSSPKILIVDDEPNITTAIRFLMEQQGFETETAQDGKLAFEAMESFQPDLLILDVMMPNMTGFEVAQAIRENPQYSQIRIIFLTAKASENDRIQGYKTGGDWYLAKPFDNQDLISRVYEVLELDEPVR